MRFLIWFVVGAAGGLLGGMGMGGGTVLIPLLTLLCGVPQHLAQSVNLFSFLPMSIVSLRIHAGNGLLDAKDSVWISVPAVAVSILAALFVRNMASAILRKAFSGFLCVLALFQIFGALRSVVRRGDR